MAKMEQKTVNSGQLTQSALDDLLSLGVGEVSSHFHSSFFLYGFSSGVDCSALRAVISN